MKIIMVDLKTLLEKSSQEHAHLCPRQILGVRLGLMGLKALGFVEPPAKKRLLTILESDGCFADGVSAASGCTVGHRTLRVEDLGKTAAVFVDTLTGKMVRVAPVLDLRTRALGYAPDESRHYFAQMQAYKVMPDEEMFTLCPIRLNRPVEEIVSRAGVRTCCELCGEEIINQREVVRDGLTLCKTCANEGYYQLEDELFFSSVAVKALPGSSWEQIP